jgi:glycosyltransferase involved in cell wall biosynthesis
VAGGVGRAYAAAEGTKETLEHAYSPLDGVVAPFPREDERPPVLVITSIRGAGLAGWIVQRLQDSHRFTVVATDGADGSPAVRALTELADRVYPIGGFLEPPVWGSAAADVARAHQAVAILRVDSSLELPAWDGRPVMIDLPATAAALGDDADLVLAPGLHTVEKARSRGQEVLELVPGPMLPGEAPDPEEAADVRAAYGIPADARLILTVGELEADRRPEDVAAVARRLRHREDLYFLLVGSGRLADTVSDLAGYFELDRFTFAPPGHPLKELVAASDCVLSTAEVDFWPQSVSAALALGRGVVATDIDGVRELVAAAGFDRSVLCTPGDLDGLAAAVVAVADEHRRPRITRKAWKAAAARSSAAARVVADALARGKKVG